MKKNNKADLLIYKALNSAFKQNKLRFYLNYEKINRPGSPVYNPWEVLLPILVPVVLGVILILWTNILVGILFIVAMLLLYIHYVKKRFYSNLVTRTKNMMEKDLNSFKTLWNYGGFVLVNAENKTIGCVAPKGDWKEFVVQNFADFMVEKKEEKKEEVVIDEKPRSRRRK